MLVLASFNGPSEIRMWVAFLGSIVLAACLGYVPREPGTGFLFGGVSGACLTFAVLGTAQGDMVTLITIIFTPAIALVAGIVGSVAGGIARAKSRAKYPRRPSIDRAPFESQPDSSPENPQDPKQ